MAIRRTEGGFEGADGANLFRRSWLGEAVERVLLLVHGFAEHSGRYDHFGSWFAERGVVVHAFDHRGHGRSDGRRNYVDRFDDFLDDLGRLQALIEREHPGAPITIVGHSMGGLISTVFVRERKPEISSLVLSAPAVTLGEALQGPRAWLMPILGRLLPRIRLDSGLPAEGLSRDPEVARRYLADPLVDTRITPRLALEMMRAVERTAGAGAEIGVPTLLLHGGDDPLVPASGSEALFASLPDGSAPPSALHVYPELRHEIFNEPEQEEIFDEVLTWLRGLAAGQSARASQAAAGAS